MFQIDPMSRTPVYEQIIEQLERFIAAGILCAGDQLPSVRGLSLELSINPNTIQKAYSELDIRGIIQSVPGKGCFVRPDAPELLREAKRKRITEFSAIATDLAMAGVSEDELITCIKQVYHPSDPLNGKENAQ